MKIVENTLGTCRYLLCCIYTLYPLYICFISFCFEYTVTLRLAVPLTSAETSETKVFTRIWPIIAVYKTSLYFFHHICATYKNSLLHFCAFIFYGLLDRVLTLIYSKTTISSASWKTNTSSILIKQLLLICFQANSSRVFVFLPNGEENIFRLHFLREVSYIEV